MVAKDLFLSNKVRPDIQPTTFVFPNMVISKNIIDWKIGEGIEIIKCH